MDIMEIVFDGRDDSHDDKSYLTWLHAHKEDGFVLNRRRGKSDSYLVLHRANRDGASCNISNYNKMARPGAFTERKYIKVCSTTIESLKTYVRKHGRSDGSFSDKCRCCNL